MLSCWAVLLFVGGVVAAPAPTPPRTYEQVLASAVQMYNQQKKPEFAFRLLEAEPVQGWVSIVKGRHRRPGGVGWLEGCLPSAPVVPMSSAQCKGLSGVEGNGRFLPGQQLGREEAFLVGLGGMGSYPLPQCCGSQPDPPPLPIASLKPRTP